MPTIYIMCGLPFSGKTTLSKEIAKYLDIPRVSFDETWVEIENNEGKVPGTDSVQQWQYVTQKCEQKVADSLSIGVSIVYDNLSDKFEHRQHISQLASENNAESKVIYLNISQQEVLSRREQNLISKLRHQVSDENFDLALSVFEPPTDSENKITFNSDTDTKTWLENNFGNKNNKKESR